MKTNSEQILEDFKKIIIEHNKNLEKILELLDKGKTLSDKERFENLEGVCRVLTIEDISQSKMIALLYENMSIATKVMTHAHDRIDTLQTKEE